jgi:allantoate deiminase
MDMRRDALAAAAELVLEVERFGRSVAGLRATVGTLCVSPGAVNVVPGSATLSVDLRHAHDDIRQRAVQALLKRAEAIARSRGVRFRVDQEQHQAAVPADPGLTELLASVIREQGLPLVRMVSGAGHDAAIMASLAPMTMLFLRSPGGVSHHPDERVWPQDVRAALGVMIRFLARLAQAER